MTKARPRPLLLLPLLWWYLRNDGYARSEVMQSDVGQVNSVYEDLSLCRFQDSEDPQGE